MENNQNNDKEYYTIDLMHILKTLWSKAWIIVISAILAAAIGLTLSAYVITPNYSSSVMLYVNNSAFSLGSGSISLSDLTASQSLVKTYTELLLNRTTLERVIDKAEVDYEYEELRKMLEAGAVNDTEIMRVTVTAEDPYEASKIANCIAEVLPVRISEIIDGASMEVVDSAIPNSKKVSPSITKYTAVAMLIGIFLSCAVIAVLAIMDDTIHDEDYIIKTYKYPILAKIPNLATSQSSGYGYYQSQNRDSGERK